MLSAVAWCAACLFAWWVSRVVVRFITPPSRDPLTLPDLTTDWTVDGYALALALLCTIAVTLGRALYTGRQQLLPFLKLGEQGVVQGGSKLSRALVVLQLRSPCCADERRSRLPFCCLRGRIQSGIRQRATVCWRQRTRRAVVTTCRRRHAARDACARDCSDYPASRRFRTCEASDIELAQFPCASGSFGWNPCWRRRTSWAPATRERSRHV